MGQNELADLLEDYHRRRAMGEFPTAEDYRERAGNDFEEFEAILRAEAELDQALDRPEPSPYPIPFGEYTLLAELGRGGVGVVYEAVHRELGRTVALKVLKSGFDTHETAIERFRREARACAQVRHDNIVEIYEAGQHEGRHYYAMALLEGRSLRTLARCGELPDPRPLAEALAGVADALHTLHERGIVHRDVKPSNIMLEGSGRMVLADFGLARTVASQKLTQTGESLGTPLYMSPEQLVGDQGKIDGRTDVYGFGATMYEILSGRPAFGAADVGALMRMILVERPSDLREVAPDVPEPLARIVMKALEKRRRDRYESAASLRDDLLAFARGEEVKGRPVSSARRVLRTLKRHGKWLAPAAVLLIGGTLGVLLRPPADVNLTVASIPSATLYVDGEDQGLTRKRIQVRPGRHELILEREGFESRSRSLNLSRDRDIEFVLRPTDPTDPKALEELATALDVQMELEQWVVMARTRSAGGSDTDLHLLFPRGDVRVEDAKEFVVRAGYAFEGEGALVFRANGAEIYRREVGDWPESTSDTRVLLPPPVRAALEEGAEITWGFHPEKGEPTTVRFRLAETDAADRVRAVSERLAELDEMVVRQIAARIYLEEGLPLAAYREARAVATVNRAPQALAVMRTALEQMDLEFSVLWNDLRLLAER